MKQQNIILTLLISILSFGISFGQQKIVNAYTQDGKVTVQFDNGNTKEIVTSGSNEVVAFSKTKNFIVYKSLVQNSKTTGTEDVESLDQYSFNIFYLSTNKSTILFTTCLDGIGGTKPSYANSSIYPNINFCNIEYVFLTNDGSKLFFQSDGWTTCPAIHYYNLKENKLVFYKAGWLQKIESNGVEVQITGVETSNNQGQIESKGRYVQTCLFDFNGILIKELTKKEF